LLWNGKSFFLAHFHEFFNVLIGLWWKGKKQSRNFCFITNKSWTRHKKAHTPRTIYYVILIRDDVRMWSFWHTEEMLQQHKRKLVAAIIIFSYDNFAVYVFLLLCCAVYALVFVVDKFLVEKLLVFKETWFWLDGNKELFPLEKTWKKRTRRRMKLLLYSLPVIDFKFKAI
jgi:hypothetical protein